MIEKILSFEYDEPVYIEVDEEVSGERVDKILALALEDYSRTFIQEMLAEGRVLCEGKTVSKSFRPKFGDLLEFTVPEPVELIVTEQDIPLEIMYEDEGLLVVNKPKGMVVHPAPGNYTDTLVNALLFHCKGSLSKINGDVRPGIVHRIDKDTSGLLLVAKNDEVHISLAAQLQQQTIDREYLAVIHGNLKQSKGTVEAPIGRNNNDRKKMCVTDKNSKNAVTHYEVLEELNCFSLIKCKLQTGRTHQIRVHMAYLGHPVAGDTVYGPGGKPALEGGQCLHSATLGFTHPVSGERKVINSPLPDYFTAFLSKIRRN